MYTIPDSTLEFSNSYLGAASWTEGVPQRMVGIVRFDYVDTIQVAPLLYYTVGAALYGISMPQSTVATMALQDADEGPVVSTLTCDSLEAGVVTVKSTLNIEGDCNIDTDLDVEGEVTFGSALGVTGALDVGATLSVNTGGASITGNSAITGTLNVTENARFRKSVIVDETVACGNVLVRGGIHNDVICDFLEVATNATVRGTLFTEGNLVMNLHTRENADPSIASKQIKMVVEPFNTSTDHNEIANDLTHNTSDLDGIRMKFQEHHPSGTITGSFIAYQGIDHSSTKNGLTLGGYHKTSAGVDNMYPHMKLYSDTTPGTVKIFVPTVFEALLIFPKMVNKWRGKLWTHQMVTLPMALPIMVL